MKKLLCFIVLLINIATAQSLTLGMEHFLNFAVQYNGNDKGFTKEQVEQAFNISLINRKASKGKVSYESAQKVENTEIPLYKLTFLNNVAIILDYNFTEPPKSFIQSIRKIRGYEELLLPRRQANGLPIYYFAGYDINDFIPTKKYWIRVYECSSKPQERCIRNAELLFAKRDLVL